MFYQIPGPIPGVAPRQRHVNLSAHSSPFSTVTFGAEAPPQKDSKTNPKSENGKKPQKPPAKKRDWLRQLIVPLGFLSVAGGMAGYEYLRGKGATPTFIEPEGFTIEYKDGIQFAKKDGVALEDKIPDNTTEKVIMADVDSVLVKAKLGKIKRAILQTDGYPMYGFELKNESRTVLLMPKPSDDAENKRLVDGLRDFKVPVTGPQDPNMMLEVLLRMASTMLYVGMIFFVMMYVMRSASGGGFMTDMSNKRVAEVPDVKMQDVQGIDEVKEDVQEIVDYLLHPENNPTGAKMPRGVLMVGPPGNGKTMLAKAIASEAGVPFFATNGSEFVEMFVGRGAGRVRALFEEAKKVAPCVIFIDEIDTVGQKRGNFGISGYGEQEQTLNQLLSELDGFAKKTGIVVIAATNRPDTLDDALLSRFNKQLPVMRPQTNAQRIAILKVHTQNKPLASNFNLDEIATITSGFSGRKLADLTEEAARLANRRIMKSLKDGEKVLDGETLSQELVKIAQEAAKKAADLRAANQEEAARKIEAEAQEKLDAMRITQDDFMHAWENILIGPGKPLDQFAQSFIERVRGHEGIGHALMCYLLGVPMHIISSQPKGETGGLVAFDESAFSPLIHTKKDKLVQLLITLGGMAAEETMYGDNEVSTGPTGDLQQATRQLQEMIGMYGMFPKEFGLFMDTRNPATGASSFSPEKVAKMEALGKQVLDNAYGAVRNAILKVPPADRDRILNALKEQPTIRGKANTQKLFDENIREADLAALRQLLQGFLKAPTAPKSVD